MKRLEPRILNQKFSRFPTPSAAVLELTNRCNEKCLHCVRESPSLFFDDELSTEKWLEIVDELALIQTFSLCLTGGECTTHPGFFEIVRRARHHKINVSIKTNALTLHRIAADLAREGVGLLEISLYGATPETHDFCTKIPGSFQRLLEGVRAARSRGLPVIFNCILFRWNAHELDAVRELARSFDCGLKRDYFLINSDTGRNLDEEFVTPEQIRIIEEKWPVSVLPGNHNKYQIPKICAQGSNSLAITARGELLSCVLIRKPLGSIRDRKLSDAWREATGGHSGSPRRTHSVDYTRFHRCTSCELLPQCSVCLGHNFAATGNFYEPPIERCFITMTLYGKMKKDPDRAEALS